MGCNMIKIIDNFQELTDGIRKALSSTGYSGKSMKKDSETLMLNIIKNDIGCTPIGDITSKRKAFPLEVLPQEIEEFQSRSLNEEKSVDLQSERRKVTIPLNIIYIWTRLPVLL